MPTKINLFGPKIGVPFAFRALSDSFTLSSKTARGGSGLADIIGNFRGSVVNGILTGPVSVISSGTSNSTF